MYFLWMYTKNVYKREGYKQTKLSHTHKIYDAYLFKQKDRRKEGEREKRLKGERKAGKKYLCQK